MRRWSRLESEPGTSLLHQGDNPDPAQNSNVLKLFLAMLVLHALCDFPLQGDFLARGKCKATAFPGIPWTWCLFWHSVIHGGAVALATGSQLLGALEAIQHATIDKLKCSGITNFAVDQLLHISCKAVWAVLLVRYPAVFR